MGVTPIIRLAICLSILTSFLITQPVYSRQRGFNELIQVFEEFPSHFNVAIDPSPEIAIPASNIFVYLFRQNVPFFPNPYLIERWNLSDDGLNYTFIIKKGTVFHDGNDVTAEDVAFSIEVSRKYSPYSANMFAAIQSISVIDETTLTVRLKHANASFITALTCPNTPILPRHIYETEDIIHNPANLNAVGSGPFKLAWYIPDSGFMLERFDQFMYPSQPYLDRYIGLKCDSSKDCFDRIVSGEADLISFASNQYLIRDIAKTPGWTVSAKGYDGIGVMNILEFNTRRGPLKQAELRSALVSSLDRMFMVGGTDIGESRIAESLLPINSPFYDNGLSDRDAELDLMLNRAIAKDTVDKLRAKMDGEEIPPIRLTWCPDTARSGEKIAAYIKQQARQIGLEIILEKPRSILDWMIGVRKWEYDITIKSFTTWGDPIFGLGALLDSRSISHDLIANTSGFSNARVNELFDQIRMTADWEKQVELYKALFEIIENQSPVWAISEPKYYTVYPNDLSDMPEGIWGVINGYDSVFWKDTPPGSREKDMTSDTTTNDVNFPESDGVTLENIIDVEGDPAP